MMYEFPKIENFDDVIHVIEGIDGFKIYENDGYKSISYRIVTKDMFFGDNFDIKRECRGLMFDNHGNLVARPYHKFFNLGENNETQQDIVDFSNPHVVMEKLDGSMVFPFKVNDNDFMFATKAGPTEIALKAYEDCIANHPVRKAWINHVLDSGITPIFEYMAPENRIVLHYEKPRLCLTGMREMFTGRYQNVYGQRNVSQLFDLPKIYTTKILEEIKNIEGMEGVVIRFHNGHMIKVKTEWYLLRHGLIDISKNPWKVVKAHLDGELDDAIAGIDSRVVDDINKIIDDFWDRVENFYDAFYKERDAIAAKGIDRKDYMKAFPIYEGSAQFQSLMPMFIFKKWGKDVPSDDYEIAEYVTKNRVNFKKFMGIR